MRRRSLLLGLAAPGWSALAATPARAKLNFPRDHGSHPDYAIEWWYVTGQLLAGQRLFGFQITFFRSRVPGTQDMRSNFAAKQLIFAHAAVTDVQGKLLLHDQRIARSSGSAQVDLAAVSTNDTDLRLGKWMLQRTDGHYLARVTTPDFALDLQLQPTQAILLQGDHGWSRKGPDAAQASWYYSLPQLEARGRLQLADQTLAVQGKAWLDHEWSQSVMHPDAVGWDWVGMNLDDGNALTAFRLRTRSGQTLWAGGSLRAAGQTSPQIFGPQDVVFEPQRTWQSPTSGASYPVQWGLRIRRQDTSEATWQSLTVKALVDNQELDSRQSTGAIYWEGLSELQDAQGQLFGLGYLEMTGYAQPLKL